MCTSFMGGHHSREEQLISMSLSSSVTFFDASLYQVHLNKQNVTDEAVLYKRSF